MPGHKPKTKPRPRLIFALLLTAASLFLGAPPVLALPEAEAIGLEWDADEDPRTKGFYIYWASRQAPTECREHTYTDAARHKLEDPRATGISFSVFLPKLRELCFAVTAYDDQDRESTYATRALDDEDYGWTGSIGPTGLGTAY